MNNRKQINKIYKNIIKKASKKENIDNKDIFVIFDEFANINEQIRIIKKIEKI